MLRVVSRRLGRHVERLHRTLGTSGRIYGCSRLPSEVRRGIPMRE
jgi:hypothetical protein